MDLCSLGTGLYTGYNEFFSLSPSSANKFLLSATVRPRLTKINLHRPVLR